VSDVNCNSDIGVQEQRPVCFFDTLLNVLW
jgi:hypothetical protein